MLDHQAYVVICYVAGCSLALLFALYAFGFGWYVTNRKHANKDTEDFVTARASQSLYRIGWSFFAGSVGSWVIVTPSQYAAFAGIVGVVAYALSCGLPIVLVALLGGRMTRDLPHVFSLADFIGWRFGPVARTLVFLVTTFLMCILLMAEYTTIGTIFSDFVGSVNWIIIIVIGVLTLTYTAYGGLAVSIATDQAQGVASALLAVLLTIYVAVTYRTPLPRPLPENLGPNYYGWISFFTLTTSLIASTLHNESFWQRVWASSDKRSLYGGAALGFFTVVGVMFLSGFGGWLAFAGGYVDDSTNANVYLMQILGNRSGGSAIVSSWVGVMVVLLAIVMNEGAVDSLQNGLAAAISGQYLKNAPLVWTRVAVVCLNVPLVIIATRGFAVLSLFLVGNLLTSCAIAPLILGLAPPLRPFFSETGFVVGFAAGVLGVTATGVGMCSSWPGGDQMPLCPAGGAAANWAVGANWAWYSNNYHWAPFLAALLASSAAMCLWDGAAWALRRFAGVEGPGISGVLMPLPGMRAITATPHWTKEGDARRRRAMREGTAAIDGAGRELDGAGEGGAGAGDARRAAAATDSKDVAASSAC